MSKPDTPELRKRKRSIATKLLSTNEIKPGSEESAAEDNEPQRELTQRRVYVLPTELVDRILAFQKNAGLTSEVEAARRLLDEALMHRDKVADLINRFIGAVKNGSLLPDAVRDVLIGHPRVQGMSFGEDVVWVEFDKLNDRVDFHADGRAFQNEVPWNGSEFKYPQEGFGRGFKDGDVPF